MEACDRLPWEECVLPTDLLLNVNLGEIKTALILDEKKKDFIDSEFGIRLLIITIVMSPCWSFAFPKKKKTQKTTETKVLNKQK